jgi:uncharacterized protein YecE (DUF72 family)
MKKHGHRRAAELRIGISGWNYPTWRRGFYPAGLPHRRELEYASRQFNSIEINGTFYGLQKPESFRRWYETAPPGFRFAVKGSRFVTHMKKLRDVKTPLANFFASGVLRLDEKLGPILWQFGPQWPLDLGRVEAFLDMLPRTTAEAARLARRHDARVTGRSWTRIDRERPLRYAFEPRHPSWFTPALLRLLRRHRVALVFADSAAKFPYAEDLTTDFVYVRLHGWGDLDAGGSVDVPLERWARRIYAWSCGLEAEDPVRIEERAARLATRRDVYVYFDNAAKVHAPFDALNLGRKLTGGRAPAGPPEPAVHAVDISTAALTPDEIAARRIEAAARWNPGRGARRVRR